MRKAYSKQLQLDSVAISDVQLVAEDVNAESRDDVGHEGFDYWQILDMTIVRHGCNHDYDKLQGLAQSLKLSGWSNNYCRIYES